METLSIYLIRSCLHAIRTVEYCKWLTHTTEHAHVYDAYHKHVAVPVTLPSG